MNHFLSPALQVTIQRICVCKSHWASVIFTITSIRIYFISKPLSPTQNIKNNFLYLKICNHMLSGLYVHFEKPNVHLQTFTGVVTTHDPIPIASREVLQVSCLLDCCLWGSQHNFNSGEETGLEGFISSLSLAIKEVVTLQSHIWPLVDSSTLSATFGMRASLGIVAGSHEKMTGN